MDAPRGLARLRLLIALVSAPGVLTGCRGRDSDSARQASQAGAVQGASSAVATPGKALVWGGPKNISMLPILAEQRGFFREAGIEVKTNYVQTGKIAMDALISKDLDFGVLVETNVAFVKYQPEADIRVVASIMEKHDDAIIARADQGIRTPKSLEGKTVAYMPATTSHRFLDLFIQRYKLDRSRLKLVNLTPPGIQAGVLNGTIAAGSVWQPFRYNVTRQLGNKVVQFADPSVYTAYCLLTVRRDFAAEHPDQVRAFLTALLRAEDFARTHRDEAIAILAKELALDPAVLAATWNEYVLRVHLDSSLVKTFVAAGEWAQTTDRVFQGRPVPKYDDVLDASFLKAVDGTRVIATRTP